MIRWAQSVRGRDQMVLFAPTLQGAISEDHSVRLFDEVIGKLDFAEWEQHYERVDGRPPIHPRVMAQVILYGLSLASAVSSAERGFGRAESWKTPARTGLIFCG